MAVAVESVSRLISPSQVAYGEALLIAVIGLFVNLASAFILKDGHHHDHGHHDHNMRAAYVHVLADAATSVLAIIALAGALYWGLGFLDPLCGLVGAAVIGVWAFGLIRDSAMVLLDAESDPGLAREIRNLIEKEMNARVADLHLWRLGPGHQGLIVFQIQLIKRIDALPITRDYMIEAERRLQRTSKASSVPSRLAGE